MQLLLPPSSFLHLSNVPLFHFPFQGINICLKCAWGAHSSLSRRTVVLWVNGSPKTRIRADERKQKGPRFLPFIILVFLWLISSPCFKDLSAPLETRPRCKGPTGGLAVPLNLLAAEFPWALNQTSALMAFVMANYKGAMMGKINQRWSEG